MSHVTSTDFRERMGALLDQVVADRAPLLVTRQGGKAAVIVMSAEEFSGMQETIHLLSSPVNAERLLASVGEIRAGKSIAAEYLPGHGFVRA